MGVRIFAVEKGNYCAVMEFSPPKGDSATSRSGEHSSEQILFAALDHLPLRMKKAVMRVAHGLSSRLAKQIGMCTCVEHQKLKFITGLFPYQQPVWLYMAFPLPFAVAMSRFQTGGWSKSYKPSDAHFLEKLLAAGVVVDAAFAFIVE